jgi:hypothetical protein
MNQESDLYSIFQDINDLVRLRYISTTGTICIYIIVVPYINYLLGAIPACGNEEDWGEDHISELK